MDSQAIRRKNTFATASLICGILALLTVTTAILPIPLGALSILFAILSHRKGERFCSSQIAGIVTSAIGLVLSAFIVVSVFAMLPTMLKTPEYRDQLNKMSEQLYGESFDDMMEELYGLDLDDLLDND